VAQNLESRLAKWHKQQDKQTWGRLAPKHIDYLGVAKNRLKRIEKIFLLGEEAALFLWLPKQGRVRGLRNLTLAYSPRSEKKALVWAAKKIRTIHFSTRVQISLTPQQDKALGRLLSRQGFTDRHEILLGKTDRALRGLVRAKNPPRDLKHLGLEVRPLKTSQISHAINLQRRVFLREPKNGYFSHTQTQLARDQQEYRKALANKSGLILGIFRGKKILGFAGLFIKDKDSAGFTLCFHYSIQGKGIAKTVYLLLLEHFKKHKIKYFYGGTAQPAVKGLGKIMGRRLVAVHRIKH
jgi:hypothetical protein